MRTYRVEAIVIRKRNFSEKDRILTLFTKERGKIEALAKGSRRPGSRLSSFSDIGTHAKFYLYETNSIDLVKEIVPIFSPEGARGKFEKTYKLEYIFKAVDKVFERDEPHPETYAALVRSIRLVSDGDFQLPFLVFLARVISDLGLGPELFDCLKCRGKICAQDKTAFSPRGGVLHTGCSLDETVAISNNEIKFLRLIFNGPFEKIIKARVDKKIFIKVFKIVKQYFDWHFGEILSDKIL